jgi:hypothetical protein
VLVETPVTGPTCEALLKACSHMYKVLGAAAKAQFAPKGSLARAGRGGAGWGARRWLD